MKDLTQANEKYKGDTMLQKTFTKDFMTPLFWFPARMGRGKKSRSRTADLWYTNNWQKM